MNSYKNAGKITAGGATLLASPAIHTRIRKRHSLGVEAMHDAYAYHPIHIYSCAEDGCNSTLRPALQMHGHVRNILSETFECT